MRKVTQLWKQRDGTKIRICDMTDLHLKNSIKLLVVVAEKTKYSMPYPDFNGEMAQYYAEQEFDNLMESDPIDLADDMFEIFEYLLNEAERRKINVYDLVYGEVKV